MWLLESAIEAANDTSHPPLDTVELEMDYRGEDHLWNVTKEENHIYYGSFRMSLTLIPLYYSANVSLPLFCPTCGVCVTWQVSKKCRTSVTPKRLFFIEWQSLSIVYSAHALIAHVLIVSERNHCLSQSFYHKLCTTSSADIWFVFTGSDKRMVNSFRCIVCLYVGVCVVGLETARSMLCYSLCFPFWNGNFTALSVLERGHQDSPVDKAK